MTGKLAVSRSGHDKGQHYVIVGEDDRYVFLADGDLKPVEKPKKKNRKHIQVIKNLPEAVDDILKESVPAKNLEIKRAIKLYLKQEENEWQKQMRSK